MRKLLIGCLLLVGLLVIVTIAALAALRRPDIPYETLASRYETDASAYVDLPGGVRMHYRDEGAVVPAPTLLLIHGFSASLHTWEPWIAQLGDAYRIVSLDLPGHGLTSAPADYQASIEAYRDAVAQFVDARGLRNFVLAGNSMGGNVSWEYALAHPDQVQALILIDSSGWEQAPEDVARMANVYRILRNPVIAPLLRDLDSSPLIRGGLEAAFFDTALVDDAMVTRYADMARAPGHRDILLQMTLGFASRNYATPERLASLHMPVLVLHGAEDRVIPVAHARLFHQAIPGAELVEFDAIGHLPHEEYAAESAALTRDFLQRNGIGAPATARVAAE